VIVGRSCKLMLTDIQNWLLEVPLTSSWGFEIPFHLLFDGEEGGVSALNLRFHGESRKTVAAGLLLVIGNIPITTKRKESNPIGNGHPDQYHA
jgi:hypothetical protein